MSWYSCLCGCYLCVSIGVSYFLSHFLPFDCLNNGIIDQLREPSTNWVPTTLRRRIPNRGQILYIASELNKYLFLEYNYAQTNYLTGRIKFAFYVSTLSRPLYVFNNHRPSRAIRVSSHCFYTGSFFDFLASSFCFNKSCEGNSLENMNFCIC